MENDGNWSTDNVFLSAKRDFMRRLISFRLEARAAINVEPCARQEYNGWVRLVIL